MTPRRAATAGGSWRWPWRSGGAPVSAGRKGVVHVVDSLVVGGAQQLLVSYAAEAHRRGDAVLVIDLSGHAEADGRITGQIRGHGAEVVSLPRGGWGAWAAFSQILVVARLLARRRPEVVQTHLTRAHVVGLLASRFVGVPAVATLHNTRVGGDGNSPRALAFETWLLRHAARSLVACGAVVERAHRQRLAPRPVTVVPNASSPPEELDEQRRRLLRLEIAGRECTLVLAVGRLIEQKGYGDLLDAFALVARLRSDVDLAVVGEGEEREMMLARARAAGIEERVHLLGRRDDVGPLLQAADLYVAASRWEGLPLALLEAMAAGLPVLATAVGDVPSVVDEGSGVLVPPSESDVLAAAMVELLDDVARRTSLGAGARRRAVEEFGVARWYDRLRAVHATIR